MRDFAQVGANGLSDPSGLLIESRRQRILDAVRLRGSASVADLADSLSVSASTIRRDLAWLAKHELLARTWGGVVGAGSLLSKRAEEFDLEGREVEQRAQKELIARRAAELVTDGDTIILDAGSTAMLVAQHLTSRRHLTVITPSLPVAWQLRYESGIEVIVTGGRVSHRGASLDGMLAEHALSQLFVDTTFLGARGVSLEDGLTNPVLEEVPLKRLMIRAAKQVVLLADSAKWGRTFVGQIAPLSAAHVAITDADVPDDLRRAAESIGVQVLIVGPTANEPIMTQAPIDQHLEPTHS